MATTACDLAETSGEQEKSPYERLVTFFGGQTNTARALGVTQPAVSQWLSGTCQMGVMRAFVAEEKTNKEIHAWELCSAIPRPAESVQPRNPIERPDGLAPLVAWDCD